MRQRERSQAITAEHGKVLSDATGEVTRGIEGVEAVLAPPDVLVPSVVGSTPAARVSQSGSSVIDVG